MSLKRSKLDNSLPSTSKGNDDLPSSSFTSQHGLVSAIKNGDKATVRSIIEGGLDVNLRKFSGQTLLHFAAIYWRDSSDIIDILLSHGADIDAVNVSNSTPLISACKRPNASNKCISYLIRKGANIHALDKHNCTAAFHAVTHRNYDVLQTLLQKGAQIDSRNPRYEDIVIRAVRGQEPKILDLLIRNGAKVQGVMAMYEASKLPGADIGKLLLEKGADLEEKDDEDATCLHIAVRCKNLSMVKFLLASGANIDAISKREQRTVMHEALANDPNVVMVKCLIDYGPDVTAKDANKRTHIEFLMYMLRKYVTGNDEEMMQAHYSTAHLNDEQRIKVFTLIECAREIRTYMLKLSLLGHDIGESNAIHVQNSQEVRIQDACLLEVAAMSEEVIREHPKLTLLDLMSRKDVTGMHNAWFVRLRVDANKFKNVKKYPHFSTMISHRINVLQANASAFVKCRELVRRIVKNQLPEPCIYLILSSFTDDDNKRLNKLRLFKD